MKNIILPALFSVLFSFSVKAQDAKTKVNARASEQQEITADNRLKKSIQQKQLSAPPERIAESPSKSNARKDVKNRSRKCCIKKTAKA